nr:ribonuclease H-like domain, reverse transcriptase, RNA-dependent DNA polymerase [Tanacetum cinerariifolium]
MFNDDFHTCMFVCFLLQEEPKRVHQALKDPSWIEAMQEELLQFKMQKVWILVDLPYGKRAIGTKWVFRNKKDERSIVVRNKARLVAQGHTQEEGINYKEVFAPVARIEAIRLFLAYASFMGFMVYQIDVKSAFLYGTIEEEVYICQPSGFEDPDHPDKVYKVVKALYGLHQAPRAWSMIGSLMYLTSSRPDIMFLVCACVRFQVTPKASHLHAVKRIFRYLKGKPHLSLWYPKDSPFDLVAYSDSDYAGAILDRKSTTGGCQFLRCRLISWQCKKQTVVATSSIEAEYVAVASCCAQVLWIQNQLLDYGDSFLLRVNTPRCDEDRLGLMELMVFLLPKVKKVRIGVNAVDLQVSAVRHMLLLEGFTQIIDFLNGSYIKYALTVNPNIYVSCIKKFWTTVAVKRVNGVTRLQALVDKKKVAVTEATIREALNLDNAEGVDYLPNEEIFAELARIGYEKPSTKLTFYKAFFSSQWNLVRNVDSPTKFYMYHRFLQLMIRKQVGDLSTHTTKYTSPALTQKVFANMTRLGKGFSKVETPLFESMLVEQQVDEEGDANENVEEDNAGDFAEGDVSAAHGEVPTVDEEPSILSPTPPTPPPQPPHDIPLTFQVQPTPPQSPQGRMIAKMDEDDVVIMEDDKEEDREVANAVKDVEEAKVDESAQYQEKQVGSQAEIYKIDMDHANKVLSMQEDETKPTEVQEVVDVVTTAKLITEVVTAASETVTAASAIINAAKIN